MPDKKLITTKVNKSAKEASLRTVVPSEAVVDMKLEKIAMKENASIAMVRGSVSLTLVLVI